MKHPIFLMILLLFMPACGYLIAQMPAGTTPPAATARPTPPMHGVVAPPDGGPLVNIPGTEELQLHSAIAAQDYVLDINLPGGYNQSTARYPVVYLLDGQWDFPLVSAVYGEQYFDGFIPGFITVGITWGGPHPNYDQLRARDFTPSSPDGSDRYGHAAKFLAFIKEELIPTIDAKFRTEKEDRTLIGSSLGGLFTLYTLFSETALFKRYVLTSPAFQWDNNKLSTYEKDYAEKRSDIPVRLFMGIGGLEPGVPAFENDLVGHLKTAHYKGLKFETLVMENTGHSGTKAEGYARGLQSVFARPSIKLDAATLDKYAGAYTTGMDTLRLIPEKGHLARTGMNGASFMLDAETETDFYEKGTFLNMHFKLDDQGRVEGALVELYGRQVTLRKIPSDTLKAQVCHWDKLPTTKQDNFDEKQILLGSTPDLDTLEIHASTLQPGMAPHPPHRHPGMEELLIVKEGTLTYTLNGISKPLGPGSVAMVLPGDLHGIVNTGSTPATYYVLKFKTKTPINMTRGREAGGSFIVDWDTIKVQPTDRGEKREVFERATALFSKIELHATTLNAGQISHLPHVHRQEEIILLRKGQVQVQIGAQFYKAEPGDLVFLASGVPHALKNTGAGSCQYYALQWQE